jgi:very-short-patch-repair endonuclease
VTTSRVRELRVQSTEAEKRLWRQLCDRQLAGFKFRRQVTFGPYIVDFVCFDCRLIVEVDGGQHAMNITKDEARTAWLESQNFRVVRFWNNEVLENLDGVLTRLLEVLNART